MRNLLVSLEDDQETSDVVFVCSDGKEFHAHRLILSKRSQVFKAMLSLDMQEGKSGIIQCADLSGKCVQMLIHFIYTGSMAKEWADSDVIWEFTYAADKYQLLDLLELIDESLGNVCKAQDALKMLKLANWISLLKNAEKKLLERVMLQFSNVGNIASLSALSKKITDNLD